MRSLIILALLVLSSTICAKDIIPVKAPPLIPIIAEELAKFNTPFDLASTIALIEAESCISATHSRCFSTKSRYSTRWSNGRRREQGQGLGQMTRTWHRNGRIRFDTLTRLTKKYKTHLKGLNWNTIYTAKRLQIRAIAFLLLENWNDIPKAVKPCDKLPMIFSAYNQGKGGLKQDRKLCGLTRGCNPNKWFGHVEKVKRWGFGTRILVGRRTAHQVNRRHINKIIYKNRPKWQRYLNKQKK